jgi:Mg2+ and Co2+ transporter CorA
MTGSRRPEPILAGILPHRKLRRFLDFLHLFAHDEGRLSTHLPYFWSPNMHRPTIASTLLLTGTIGFAIAPNFACADEFEAAGPVVREEGSRDRGDGEELFRAGVEMIEELSAKQTNLKRQLEEMHQHAERLAAAGEEDAARKMHRQIQGMIQKHFAERKELGQKFERVVHQLKERGMGDAAERLAREAREAFANREEGRPQDGVDRPRKGGERDRPNEGGDRPRDGEARERPPVRPVREQPRGEINRGAIEEKIMHLRQAAGNLREAGLHGQAHELIVEAERLEAEIRRPAPRKVPDGPDALRREVAELRQQVGEMRRQMAELREIIVVLIEKERQRGEAERERD